MVALAHSEINVRASPAQVMAVIADLAHYPAWSEGVVSAAVVDREPDGRPRRAQMRLEAGGIAESCEFEYDWQGDSRVEWHLTSGTIISQLEGSYSCQDNGDGTTTVGYDLDLDVVIPLIGSVQQKATRRIVRSALRKLRDRVEEMAGARSASQGAPPVGASPTAPTPDKSEPAEPGTDPEH